MSKVIHTSEGRVVKRRWVVPVVVIILIIGAGVTGVLVYLNGKKTAPAASTQTLSADDLKQIEGDNRSQTTKIASLTARNQADAGSTDAAVATLRTAIGQTNTVSEKIDLYKQIASIYTNAKNHDSATAAINDAIKLTPNDWTLYKSLGLIDEAFGDTSAAIADFTKADSMLSKSDKDYIAYHNSLQSLIRNAGTPQ